MIPAKVSILIAARNEEENLPFLLESLIQLSYPKEQLQILIGNDASTDNTQAILSDYQDKFDHIKIIEFEERKPDEILGKTRILERLIREASGDYFFFTDADIELSKNWVEALLHYFNGNVGVVVGITSMKPKNFLSAMQGLEWLTALHLMHLLSNDKIETTGLGNNMAVSKKAYWATGGYAKIPFSIVEDYALYKAIIAAGFGFKQSFSQNALAFTIPPEKFFEQRKRWMKGAFESGSFLIIPSLIQSLFLPLFIFLLIWDWPIALITLSFLFVFHLIHIAIIEKKLKINGYLIFSPLFVLYLPISWFLQLMNYFIPGKLAWKDRTY
jgi:cellulose synthase/poly-beta-1,6-N-acetylglucosamine synthase-like glycosyltransferase